MNNRACLMLPLRSTLVGLAAFVLYSSALPQANRGALSSKDSSIIKESDRKILSVHGKYDAYDSLSYNVIRRWYQNGNPMLVCITDKEKKITRQWEYYVNGQLREEGGMTAYSNIPIGIWHHFEPDGSLKEIIDHDALHKISYHSALQIARENGVSAAAPDVSLIEMKGKTYWQVVHWRRGKGRSRAEGVNIDTVSGEVTKTSLVSAH